MYVCRDIERDRESMYKKIKRERECVCREVQSLCGQRKRARVCVCVCVWREKEIERICVCKEKER